MDEVLKTTDWVTCPYDPNHIMKYSKFHNHFVKCKAAHPDDIREQCPYYASELIHPDKMKEHLLTCNYRTLYPNLFFDSSNLPKYEAPCHFNLGSESENESDDDAKTVITVDRDDRSSLFSATTRSYKANSTISKPIGKIHRNNFIDHKPRVESYAFAYIDDDDPDTSFVEILGQEDSGNYSWESANRDGSPSNPSSSRDENNSSLEVDSPSRPFEPRMGLGRGKVIQRLLTSSTTSLDSFGSAKKGSGRGAWFRQKITDFS